MNKPKFNIDAHAYWLLCEGQQVEVDGQKIQLTIVEEVKKNIDLHKDSWGVLNDGSQRFKDNVIKWINEHKNPRAQGVHIANYYGVISGGSQVCFEGTENFTHILTIDEFCAIAYPEKEEGSELIGKWVRYCHKGYEHEKEFNKWFEIIDVLPATENYSKCKEIIYIHGDREPYGDICFDLVNPLDYNPETLIGKYWNGAKITGIYINENDSSPYFSLESTVVNSIKCSKITPSDVTDTPPLPSLKYEDCFERVKPVWFVDTLGKVKTYHSIREDGVKTEHQAKQLAATIKLMTIMHDANGGEWVPSEQELILAPVFVRRSKQCTFDLLEHSTYSPIYFRDYETAQRAYEANKEIFHDYFGTGGENE